MPLSWAQARRFIGTRYLDKVLLKFGARLYGLTLAGGGTEGKC